MPVLALMVRTKDNSRRHLFAFDLSGARDERDICLLLTNFCLTCADRIGKNKMPNKEEWAHKCLLQSMKMGDNVNDISARLWKEIVQEKEK